MLETELDAFNKVNSIADDILDILCKIWIFNHSTTSISDWMDDLSRMLSQAPIYGISSKIILSAEKIEHTLWDYDRELDLDRRVYRVARENEYVNKYIILGKRESYRSFERLNKFYKAYAEELVQIASSNLIILMTVTDSKLSYDNLNEIAKRKYYKRMTYSLMENLVKEIAYIDADDDFVTDED